MLEFKIVNLFYEILEHMSVNCCNRLCLPQGDCFERNASLWVYILHHLKTGLVLALLCLARHHILHL